MYIKPTLCYEHNNSNLMVISHSSNICGQHLNSFSSPTRVIEDHKYVSDMLFFTQLSICVIGFAYMYVLFRTVTVRDKGMINFAIASGSHVYMKRTFIHTYKFIIYANIMYYLKSKHAVYFLMGNLAYLFYRFVLS